MQTLGGRTDEKLSSTPPPVDCLPFERFDCRIVCAQSTNGEYVEPVELETCGPLSQPPGEALDLGHFRHGTSFQRTTCFGW